ncbi:hypothetical protein STANM337S_06537 [Streptomyces tanashiensis]
MLGCSGPLVALSRAPCVPFGVGQDEPCTGYVVRTGVHWRDLPERLGPWRTVYEQHRLCSADGTWERLLQPVQAGADAAGEIDWDVSVDSAIV